MQMPRGGRADSVRDHAGMPGPSRPGCRRLIVRWIAVIAMVLCAITWGTYRKLLYGLVSRNNGPHTFS
jgi:hypothetical protein